MNTKNDNSLNTISNRNLFKMLLTVALPIALQSLIGSSLSLVDNLMVGALGELELNAVGVSVQIFFIYWMIVHGFCSGTATYISQFFGVKDYKNIRRTTGIALTATGIIGMTFFVVSIAFPREILRIFTKYPDVIEAGVDYIRIGAPTFLMIAIIIPFTIALRATQQTKIPLYASIIALGLNTFLNYVLIFGNFGAPEMGIKGAALATVFSRFVEMTLICTMVFRKTNILHGRVSEFFEYKRELLRRVVRNSLPTTINEALWSTGAAMYIAAFSRMGITEGAAIQACNTINNLFLLASFSMGDAILIIAGQKLGEGKMQLAYNISKKIIKAGVTIGVLLGIAIILTGPFILNLFDFTPRGQDLAEKILIVYGVGLPLEVYNVMHIAGTLRCGGDTKFTMYVETGTMWLIGVPLAFITALYIGWPIYFAVLAVKLEAVVKQAFLTKRYLSKKWLKNVIYNIEQ